ncbi:unnamed protein product, partial [Pleuronectes platessa]
MQMAQTGDRTADLQVGGRPLYPSATAARVWSWNYKKPNWFPISRIAAVERELDLGAWKVEAYPCLCMQQGVGVVGMQDLPGFRGNLLPGRGVAFGFNTPGPALKSSLTGGGGALMVVVHCPPPADGTGQDGEQVCRVQDPEPADLSMEEESDTRKINNSFLRDHNYATE